MNKFYITIALAPGLVMTSAAYAQTAGNLAGAPVMAAGNVLSTASANHAQIAPTVNRVSPTAEPTTDGVTNVLAAAGAGVSGTGQRIGTSGVQLGSTSVGNQSVGRTIRGAQSSTALLGTSAGGRPLIGVGASTSNDRGTVVASTNGRQIASASVGSQSVGGALRSAQSSSTLLGTGAGGRPLVSVGASSPHSQGTVVAAVNGR